MDRASAPYARAARVIAGVSLVLAGLLNGLSQYLTHLLHGDLMFTEYVRWAADHAGVVRAEQAALVASMLFAPLGLLGIAQVCRWRAPRLTAAGIALAIWGMWGFHNLIAMGYLMTVTAPDALGADLAVQLSDALGGDPGAVLTALVPHLLGSFFGLVLLSVACWRSAAFPRSPLVLLVVFLVWDFTLPSVGVFEPHLLLAVAWAWLGLRLARMTDPEWHGAGAIRRA